MFPVGAHLIAIATAGTCLVAVVVLHFEGMVRLGHAYKRHRGEEGGAVGRHLMLRMVFGLVVLHTVSIMIFGVGFWTMLQLPDAGSITGAHRGTLFDAFYMSAMTYSTVGFGDLAPKGPIRWLAGTEALIGLMMVAWSASFAFMEMSRHWRDDLR
ncbi:potassium channel family protein [Cognatilysobacter lacus]|uniref:Two pore domain potassium channel family protein n=1 Tax=Cognatilysobacter lacus TaxID=1643323 RepID=A0A5D8ZDU6_9GAMM|nr:potassium channel family protein [Lysobacter lacus]TZF90824.1 two pore domain potassium channel family protein [Lysobacter lacus]